MFILAQEAASSTPIKIFLNILALFLIGSMLGYVVEVLFRRFFSVKKWVNPGFMKGPWLPMYGFGLVFMFFLCMLYYSVMPDNFVFYNPQGGLFSRMTVSGPTVYDLLIILSLTLTMILLELIAGLIFVKGFKIRLWDYSNMKGNFQGIICPVFNLIWFGVAVIYYYGINPFVYSGFQSLFRFLFGTEGSLPHIGTIFILGLAYGVFLVDLVVSVNLFSKVEKFAKTSGIVQHYEKLREEARKSSDEAKKKFFNLLPDAIKKSYLASKEKEKDKPKLAEKVYEEARKAVLIDPDKKGTDKNYDEHGRPIKEE